MAWPRVPATAPVLLGLLLVAALVSMRQLDRFFTLAFTQDHDTGPRLTDSASDIASEPPTANQRAPQSPVADEPPVRTTALTIQPNDPRDAVRQAVVERMLACYLKTNATPTWFGISKRKVVPLARRNKTQTWGTYVPALRGINRSYVFNDEQSYMDDYARSRYAYTWKKAGWDCMRHVEILGAGAIPLFYRISRRPMCTLVGHPFDLYADIESAVAASLPPNTNILSKPALAHLPQEEQWARDLETHFRATLTCGAMIETLYLFWQTHMAKSRELKPPRRVLFYDRSLLKQADYMSVTTLIGLNEAWDESAHVDVVWRPPYLYSDWPGRPQTLYGMGFNYVRSQSFCCGVLLGAFAPPRD